MSFDLERSLAAARLRLGPVPAPAAKRARRTDAGRARLHPEVCAELERWSYGYDRPRLRDVRAALAERCARRGLRPPSRAAIYAWLARAPAPTYRVGELPAHVRALIHNLDDEAEIPGSQLVAAIVNHGDTRALSFAAGMPWLCLARAAELRDFRPKSLALLQALLRGRGL